MALQPAVLGAKRVGHGHRLRGDEDLKARGEIFEDRLRVGHQGQSFKEVLGVEKSAELGLAVEGRDLPETFSQGPLASRLRRSGCSGEWLRERVGHDLIHIDTDSLHAEFF